MSGVIAIAGGGVAGVTTALVLGSLGLKVTLLERESTLVSGPPFCHLHAGGNLYREISDDQCTSLLHQSIDFARLYPFSVDYRPTVIAIPKEDEGNPIDLLRRLEFLRDDYRKRVKRDPGSAALGHPDNYYQLFDEEDIRQLHSYSPLEKPARAHEWMIPLARHLKMEDVKFPLILVREYGLNLFRLAAGSGLALEKMPNVTLLRDTEVTAIEKSDRGYRLHYQGKRNGTMTADYLVNAAGFRTGLIDDMLGIREKRMVEFKAAYTAYWRGREALWPEVIFHGERGTPKGMGQFTPYPGGYIQLHGMTPDITLFKEGLASSTPESSYPRLPKPFIEKIEKGWPPKELEERTHRAIGHLARFIPDFENAAPGGPPLFGAQQIPGDDPTLRVAEVSFPADRYARCEIVKVSSVTDMAEAIISDLEQRGLIAQAPQKLWDITALQNSDEEAIDKRARSIARSRNFPEKMAGRCVAESL